MRTIICKKCGATIDASLGECPNCGAMYYILPDEEDAAPAQAAREGGARQPGEAMPELNLDSANNDDIFNTSVWRTDPIPAQPDPDATRAFRPQESPATHTQPRPAAPPPQRQQVRQAAQTPQRQQPRQAAQSPQRQQPRQAAQSPQRQQPRQAAGGSGGRVPPNPSGGGDYEQDERNERKLRSRRIVVAAVALVAVLTIIIALMSNAFDFNKNAEKVFMPSLVGENYTESVARSLLESLGLDLKIQIETRYDPEPATTVIGQSVKTGKQLKKGDTVILTVSLGPKSDDGEGTPDEVIVPGLVGGTYEQAKSQLDALGLKLVLGEDQYSNEVAEGRVISQSPGRNATARKGDSVLIILSKGIEPSPSPTGFTITVTAGSGGSVSPKGVVTVNEGENQTFTITPSNGYEIREVKVDGHDVGAVSSYTFENVTQDHVIYVVFKIASTNPSSEPPSIPPSIPPEESAIIPPDPLEPVE